MILQLVLVLIRFYQRFISSLTPPSCRFSPTCSHYTYQALERFGLARGGWLALRRVCRCHPWNVGGFDPVPETLCTTHSPEHCTNKSYNASHKELDEQ